MMFMIYCSFSSLSATLPSYVAEPRTKVSKKVLHMTFSWLRPAFLTLIFLDVSILLKMSLRMLRKMAFMPTSQ